jgi:diguanylate cyclase (GGDEF)-like protein
MAMSDAAPYSEVDDLPLAAQVADLREHVARLRAQVSALQAERRQLWWAAGHDELTGLPNRRMFHALAPWLVADESHGSSAVVVVLDLDGFKPINDTWGHYAGDHVLCTIARRLAGGAAGQFVARLGGDEFAAVLTDPCQGGDPAWWQPTVKALCAALREPITVAGNELSVTASMGVAPTDPPAPIDELLRRADQAMYLSKSAGPAVAVQVWRPSPTSHAMALPVHRDHPRLRRTADSALGPRTSNDP